MRLSEAVATQPLIRIAVSSKGTAGSPGVQGPAGDVARAANRSAMAAIPAAADGMVRFLGEGRRKGLFQFDESDLSAEVALDIDQGLYIAPANDDTGESGAWVRVFDGPVMADWFGLAGDDATDDGPAVLRMFDVLDRNAAGYVASRGVDFGPRTYFLGTSTINIRACMKVRGAGIRATKLRWAAGASGIIVQRVNTADGLTGDVPAFTVGGGDLSRITDMTLQGGYAGIEGEFHGVALRARAYLADLLITSFQGDGIFSRATAGGGATEGNTNCAQIERVVVNACRHGLYCDSADVNAWLVQGCDFSANRAWGAWDSSFLGNTYNGCHTSANGWDGALGSIPTGSTTGGYRYSVIPGQEVWCSANAPTGTTANNQGWRFVSAGGVYNGIVTWVSGTTFRAGGSYYLDGGGGNARNCLIGCYSESDQNESIIALPAIVIGGLGVSESPDVAGLFGNEVAGLGPGIGSRAGIFSNNGLIHSQLGGMAGGVEDGTILATSHPAYGPSAFRMMWGHTANGAFDPTNLWFNYNNGFEVFRVTGPSTTEQFGSGAAQPYHFHAVHFALGAYGSARKLDYGTAAPTTGTHARGEIMFNIEPSAGGKAGWICTATGTPGTWKAFGVIDA